MNVSIHHWNQLSAEERSTLLQRSQIDIGALVETVRPVVEAVRDRGDEALCEYTARFDGVALSPEAIAVPVEEFEAAEAALDPSLRRALDYAIENVSRFHRAQVETADRSVQVREGIFATERSTPIDSVGLYVPSGRGSFPSMMYMLAVPAVLAGVPTVAVTTPPRSDGTVDPAVLYAARQCGVGAVYRVGGAQAVASLTWGTNTVPAVQKIVGPGSAYVAAAKRLVADHVDVGVPAGPSESMVVADQSADPWRVALDLMIEAEHGSDSSAVLVTPSASLAAAVVDTMQSLISDVPQPRRTFLTDVFSSYGGVIVVHDLEQAVAIVNDFAPEHLMLHTSEPRALASRITNASEVLLGPHTAFSLANYATGPNAVLPTGGWAKSFGPVAVQDFQKRSTVIEVTATGYAEMRDHVVRLADHEGFFTHAAALRRRNEQSDRP